MSLADVCQVTISTTTVNVAQAGFGVPMIMSHKASFPERVRFYTTLSGVLVDFVSTGPEYHAAAQIFAQNPRPSMIAIGKVLADVTQEYTIVVRSVQNSTVYAWDVNGVTQSITSDSSATNDEIATAIQAAFSCTGFTASLQGEVGSKYVKVLADAVGNWCGLKVADTTKLGLMQVHAAPTDVDDELDAIKLESDQWYAVISLYNSEGYIAAVAAWAESNERLYIASCVDIGIIVNAYGGSTDIAHDEAELAHARTAIMYHPDAHQIAEAAWFGKLLPKTPGSETWAFKTLSGVSAPTLTGTHIVNLKAKKANWYQTIAGVSCTFDGKVAANEYVDVIRGRDWLKARIAEAVFALLAGADKVPYTDPGIAMVEAKIRGVLLEAVANGLLAADPAPVVTVPLAANVSAANKANRLLPDIQFTATLAGAIHQLTITGTISA